MVTGNPSKYSLSLVPNVMPEWGRAAVLQLANCRPTRVNATVVASLTLSIYLYIHLYNRWRPVLGWKETVKQCVGETQDQPRIAENDK